LSSADANASELPLHRQIRLRRGSASTAVDQ
jgi:hypothetical protein